MEGRKMQMFLKTVIQNYEKYVVKQGIEIPDNLKLNVSA